MIISRYTMLGVMLTLVLFAGGQAAAGGSDLASVKGKITFNGRPLAGKKIIFHLGDGQFAGAKIKEDGTFQVDWLPVGTHKVTVEATVKGLSILPPKYSAEEVSELRISVRKGENMHNFDLTSR